MVCTRSCLDVLLGQSKGTPNLSWDVLLLNCSSDRTLSYVSYKLFTVVAAPHILERAEFHHCAVKCPSR